MSRTLIPLAIGDISAFARSLHSQLSAGEALPGHLALLNMIARAAGHRNFQALRAAAEPAAAVVVAEPVDLPLVRRAARHFDDAGRLATWPAKASLQTLCLWGIWSKLPARAQWSEMELNALLRARHLFGDHALLRRELCDQGFLQRNAAGSQYRRVERRPGASAAALIGLIAGGAK